jgi:hypothetical protein
MKNRGKKRNEGIRKKNRLRKIIDNMNDMVIINKRRDIFTS